MPLLALHVVGVDCTTVDDHLVLECHERSFSARLTSLSADQTAHARMVTGSQMQLFEGSPALASVGRASQHHLSVTTFHERLTSTYGAVDVRRKKRRNRHTSSRAADCHSSRRRAAAACRRRTQPANAMQSGDLHPR